MNWRDVSPAPRDGTYVLLFCPYGQTEDEKYVVAFWGDDGAEDFNPEHWWFHWEGAGNTIPNRPTHFCFLEKP